MIWKDIPGQEGRYQASDTGQIRSVSRVVFCKNGTNKTVRGRVLKQTPSTKGYLRVSFKEGVKTYVHHIIMLTFVGPRPEGMYINHIDGNKTNNSVSNLEYCTPTANAQHAVRTGLARIGERHSGAVLTNQQVAEIKQRGKYDTYENIGKDYGVDKSVISSIFHDYSWSHIMWPDNVQHNFDQSLNKKLTREQVIEIKYRGKYDTYAEIGKKYGVGASAIRQIFNNKTWVDVPWPENNEPQRTWKDIPILDNIYQASNDGAIRITKRVVRCKNGKEKHFDNAIKKQLVDCGGNPYVRLGSRRYKVCDLVMMAFVGVKPDNCFVDHLDGDVKNNSINNLAYKPSTSEYRAENWKRLTREQVIEIKRRGKYDTYENIGKDYGVSVSAIYNIFSNRVYADIPWPDEEKGA